jgi:hypothetical protein
MGENFIFAALREENEAKCDPPLLEDEVRKIAKGIQRYGPEDPFYVSSGPPTFPLSSLPPSLRGLVQQAATSIGCAPEFIAVPMLAILGAAIGNSHVVEIKKGWTEPAVLYVAVVADSGEKKTPALKVAAAPAKRRQMALKREHDKAMSDYHAQRRQWEVDKKLARENDEPAPSPPVEPVLPRTLVGDATVEALADRLEENPQGVLCIRDELLAWVRAMNQYKGGNGADRQQWLEMWSTGSIFVDRKGRKEPLVVSRAFVCVVGSIQPKILPDIGSGREDGLLDRLLFAYPDPVASRYSDDEISEEATTDYEKLYDRLYDLPMLKDDNGEPDPLPMELTPRAKEVFRNEVDSLRGEMERPEFPDYLKGPWSKLEAYLARLSLILALVRIVDQDHLGTAQFDEVNEQDVQAAVDLLVYFKGQARKVYAKLHDEKPQKLLRVALKDFLHEQGGRWENMTEELYNIFKARSAPGLPGGPVPFGKMLRQIARQDDDLTLEEGHKGKSPILKLSLSTLDTAVHTGSVDTDAEGTESKSEEIATDVEGAEEPGACSAPS